THSDDSTHLKIQIAKYIAVDPATTPVSLPIDNGSFSLKPWSGRRGYNHPVLACLLCPISEIERFEEDPKETIKHLQDGGIELTADTFPAFLWKGDPFESDYNPDDMMHGFLEGF
ncbi:hypothetical protein BDR07DRAFT_1253744, partial [Suillus spraguei]